MNTIKKGNPKKKSKKEKVYLKLNSKTRAERIHATNRLEERYGIEYTAELRKSLISKILNNETINQFKQSNRVCRHIILHDKVFYNVVYDKKRQEIITFLPPE